MDEVPVNKAPKWLTISLMPQIPSRPVSYHPLSLVLAAAVIGILCDKLTAFPNILWGSLFFVFFLFWGIMYRKWNSVISTTLLLAACFSFFGFYHHYCRHCFADNEIGNYVSKTSSPAAVRGTVIEMPRYFPCPPTDTGYFFAASERTFFTIRATHIRDGTDWISVSGKVSVSTDSDARHLRIGDSLQLFGQIFKPVEPQNPGDYNYAAVLRSYRILCRFRCSAAGGISVQKTGHFSIARFLESVRRAGAASLQRNMSPATAAAATAMILGIREGVDEETVQSLIETGTMHLLAISGLHIGLVAVCTAFLLCQFGISRRTTALILILIVFIYLLITDVRPPAIRATIMVAVAAAALFSGRKPQSFNTLAAAALGVLFINPSELFQFGTQLSFLATSGFFWVPPLGVFKRAGIAAGNLGNTSDADNTHELRTLEVYESRRWKGVLFIQHLFRNILQLFLASFVIWLITMPLLLAHIHLFTPVTLLVNPLLWFPLTAAMSGGFCTMLFGSLPFAGVPAGCFFGFFADSSFQLLFGMITFFQHLGGHYWVPGPPGWWNVVFYTVFLILTFFPVRKIPLWYLLFTLVFWIIAGFAASNAKCFIRQWKDELTFSVFSVGHGNCTLIVTPQNKTIIYDIGCITSPHKAADVMSNALWRIGKTSIDTVILSHSDNDHINGLLILAERFSVGKILVSPYFFEPLKQMNKELRQRNITVEQLGNNEFQDGKLLLMFQKMLITQKIPLYEIGEGDNLEQYGLPNSTVYHPPKQGFREAGTTNAASLVVRFEHRHTSVLLTGDLDGQQRSAFLKQEPLPCDIMMIPHHGGKSNQTNELLKWAKPKILIISAGRFTHRDSVIEEFRSSNYEVHSTFLEGAIVLSF